MADPALFLLVISIYGYFEGVEGAFGLGAGFIESGVGAEDDSHAAVSMYFGLAEYTHLGAGLGKYFVEIAEFHGVAIAFNHHRT